MTVFFQFGAGIKILSLTRFFVIALMRAASCPGSGGYLGFAVAHSLLEPPSNLSFLYRAVAAAALISFWRVICPEL